MSEPYVFFDETRKVIVRSEPDGSFVAISRDGTRTPAPPSSHAPARLDDGRTVEVIAGVLHLVEDGERVASWEPPFPICGLPSVDEEDSIVVPLRRSADTIVVMQMWEDLDASPLEGLGERLCAAERVAVHASVDATLITADGCPIWGSFLSDDGWTDVIPFTEITEPETMSVDALEGEARALARRGGATDWDAEILTAYLKRAPDERIVEFATLDPDTIHRLLREMDTDLVDGRVVRRFGSVAYDGSPTGPAIPLADVWSGGTWPGCTQPPIHLCTIDLDVDGFEPAIRAIGRVPVVYSNCEMCDAWSHREMVFALEESKLRPTWSDEVRCEATSHNAHEGRLLSLTPAADEWTRKARVGGPPRWVQAHAVRGTEPASGPPTFVARVDAFAFGCGGQHLYVFVSPDGQIIVRMQMT